MMFLNKQSLLIILFTSIMIFNGCSGTTHQYNSIANIKEPLSQDESIIEIVPGAFKVAFSEFRISSNGVLIGILGENDKSLVWKTKPNKLNCIDFKKTDIDFLTIDKVMFPYKCFYTKPGKVITLKTFFDYDISSFTLFTPLKKLDFESKGKDTYKIDSISINSEIETKHNIVQLLKDNLVKELKDSYVTENETKIIKLYIDHYQEGNAALRWTVPTVAGTTMLTIKLIIEKDEKIIDTYVTKLSIPFGGLYTVNADKYIFEDAAKDIVDYLVNN